jgi:hypothetical protein
VVDGEKMREAEKDKRLQERLLEITQYLNVNYPESDYMCVIIGQTALEAYDSTKLTEIIDILEGVLEGLKTSAKIKQAKLN